MSPRGKQEAGEGYQPSPHPACLSPVLFLLSHHCCCSTRQRHLMGGGGPLADLRSCMLTQLSAHSQQLLGLLSPASPGEYLCCSGQPSEPSPAGNHLTVPRETSYSTGQPGSKQLCFFWNRTPGTGFFLHRHFPQFTEGRASQVLCHQPALLVQASLSQAPN